MQYMLLINADESMMPLDEEMPFWMAMADERR